MRMSCISKHCFTEPAIAMKIIHPLIALLVTLVIGLGNTPSASAAEEYTLTIKDHKFTPETLEIPANQKVKLVIVNQDTSAEEFESYDLHREKIVQGNSKITVFVGPLKPGTYKYFGEFHMDTAKGTIVAK